jgi:hypothetical protein
MCPHGTLDRGRGATDDDVAITGREQVEDHAG